MPENLIFSLSVFLKSLKNCVYLVKNEVTRKKGKYDLPHSFLSTLITTMEPLKKNGDIVKRIYERPGKIILRPLAVLGMMGRNTY